MMKKLLALILSTAVVSSGCASGGASRMTVAPSAPIVKPHVMSEYAQRLPPGSQVRVETARGSTLRGTLMQVTSDALTLQRHTRVPEPPIEIAIADVARLTLDERRGTSTAKAVGIGVASGVGAFFGIMAIIFAAYGD